MTVIVVFVYFLIFLMLPADLAGFIKAAYKPDFFVSTYTCSRKEKLNH